MRNILVCMLLLTVLYGCGTQKVDPDIGFLLTLDVDPEQEPNARAALAKILQQNGLAQTGTAGSHDGTVDGHTYSIIGKGVFCSLELHDDGELRFAGVITTKGEDGGSVRRAIDSFRKEYPEAALFFGEWDACNEYVIQNRPKGWKKTN